jgi:hypothetical protein
MSDPRHPSDGLPPDLADVADLLAEERLRATPLELDRIKLQAGLVISGGGAAAAMSSKIFSHHHTASAAWFQYKPPCPTKDGKVHKGLQAAPQAAAVSDEVVQGARQRGAPWLPAAGVSHSSSPKQSPDHSQTPSTQNAPADTNTPAGTAPVQRGVTVQQKAVHHKKHKAKKHRAKKHRKSTHH